MNWKLIRWAILLVVLFTGSHQLAIADPAVDDPGIPDTVRVVSETIPLGTTKFALDINLYNDEQLGGFNLPIKWDSPDITCDSVSFAGTRVEYINTKLFSIDNVNRRLQAGVVIFFEAYLQPGDGLIYRAYFTVAGGASDQVITVDSTFYPPGGTFALTTTGGLNFVPQMNSGTITYGEPQTDPAISFDPISFVFSATEGDPNPPTQLLSIDNVGAGTLNWTVSKTSGWLTLTPASGTDAGTVTVGANITGLPAGIYYDTIVIADPAATNSPQKVPVTLTLAEPPAVLALNPTSFSYTITAGDALPNDQLNLTNTGGGSLNWTAANAAGWLALTPTSGTGNGIVTLHFDVAGLTAGIYYDTITVTDLGATNSPQKAAVMVTVEPPPPTIALSPTEFIYAITEGDGIVDTQLTVTNTGGGTLAWTATITSGWLTIDPASGSGNETITMSFDVTGLTAGTYYDTITVADPNATNSPQKAAVTVTVAPPPATISLSPTTFTHTFTEGGSLPDEQLNITNTGGSTLNWTAANQSAWLTLDPTSGAGDGAVTLSYDVAALAAGIYMDTITVTDAAATNSPQIAVVTLNIGSTPIPIISVTPTSFMFEVTEGDGNPPAEMLRVDNTGEGTLDWSASVTAGWLTVDPAAGSDGDEASVSVDVTGLAPGTYVDTIVVIDPIAGNSPVAVPVTLTIEALPFIVVEPTSFEYMITEGDNLPMDMLFIFNSGGGSLSWTVSNLTGWITLDPTGGSNSDTLVELTFDVSGVPAGVYYDTITVSDPAASNSPVEVPVMLTINELPPEILLSLPVIDLLVTEGDLIPDEQITFSNIGGGTLNWTASNNTGWVMLDPTSGTGDGVVTVSFDITGIGPGFYVDTVFIEDPAAINSPQYTIITMEVLEAPPDADTVYVETVGAFVGQQVMVGVSYVNFTTTQYYNLPLSFDPTVVSCDSVSFDGTRMVAIDESTIEIDNVAGTIDIYGFSIGGAILGPGSGLIAKMYFSVDPAAGAQFVAIDTSMVNPFEFTVDIGGTLKKTEFFSGGLDITDTPCFDFPTDTVAFNFNLGGIVPEISFPVTNTCGGLLEWSVTAADSWATFMPASGTENDLVAFSVDTTGLVPGSYVTTATFESNGEGTPYVVVVTLNLTGVPILELSTELIEFGQVCMGEVLLGSFDILNAGYGTLEWHADSPPSVALSAYSGTAPSTVEFDIDTDGMAPGNHHFNMIIYSDNGLIATKSLSIKATVIDCSACTFDIAEVEGPEGNIIGVPIVTNGIADVAGLQFNVAYDESVLSPDSATSTYMTGPTIGFANGEVHYVWSDIVNPITVAQDETVLTMWFTVIGSVGEVGLLEWSGTNEITDPYGIPYMAVTYCEGSVTVIPSDFTLGGNIDYYYPITVKANAGIPGVTVDVTGAKALTTTTDEHGDYLFADMSPGGYMVTPNRANDDWGVSIADVIKIQRHIAFVEEFTMPYQMIAADINGSASVTIADVVLIRRYLADLDPLESGNWMFAYDDFALTMDNWWDCPNDADIDIINQNLDMVNFTGVRMGDVNGTWMPDGVPSAGRYYSGVGLTLPDLTAMSSTGIEIPILVTNFTDVAGIEVHITYDGSYIVVDSITSAYLAGMTINAPSGQAHIIWDDFLNPLTLADGDTLAIMHAHIIPGPSTTVALNFTARCELTDEIGNPYELALTNGSMLIDITDVDDETDLLPLSFELKQNYPNPFNPTTTIAYSVDHAMSLLFEVYNVSGQLVDRIDLGQKSAGSYTFTYSGDRLASGVYTYRVVGDGLSGSKKMILVK